MSVKHGFMVICDRCGRETFVNLKDSLTNRNVMKLMAESDGFHGEVYLCAECKRTFSYYMSMFCIPEKLPDVFKFHKPLVEEEM